MVKQYISQKSFLIQWATILPAAILAVLNSSKSVDVQVADTYFVVTFLLLFSVFSTSLALTGGIYWLCRGRSFFRELTVVHVVGTAAIVLYILVKAAGSEEVDAFVGIEEFKARQEFNSQLVLGGLLWLTLQLLFLINLGIAFIRPKSA